jgi:hypothetical protein
LKNIIGILDSEENISVVGKSLEEGRTWSGGFVGE